MTNDPIVWYVEQLDYVERVALTARDDEHAEWWWDNPQTPAGTSIDRHIALHNPDAVLVDVEIKRKLIADHVDTHDCGSGPLSYRRPYVACETARLMLLEFAARPGYQEAWRP